MSVLTAVSLLDFRIFIKTVAYFVYAKITMVISAKRNPRQSNEAASGGLR